MKKIKFLYIISLAGLLIFLTSCTSNTSDSSNSSRPKIEASAGSAYGDLVDYFQKWREFQAPDMLEGVPDYSKTAMEKQHQKLAEWQQKLLSFDTTGWPIKHQIDLYLVWAEMNGLDFDHRVKRPWERDPSFYIWFYSYPTDVPEREGPNIHGAIELPRYKTPLSQTDAEEINNRLKKTSAVFEQARINLTGNAKDLWVAGTKSIISHGEDLVSFSESVENEHPELAQTALEASRSYDEFASWLEKQAGSKTGTSGTGKENYSWNLKNVHLLPYTWEEEKLLLERELARSHSALRLEEHRNRELPKLTRIDNAEDYDRQLNEGVTEYMSFLKESEIMTIKEYMEPAMRARVGKFTPADGLRGFFAEITYRDGIIMRTHDYHWIELARMREEPNESPIRSAPLLYNIWDGRSEGIATAMEELMMNAGFIDNHPRSKELIWILLAQRCARGLGALYQHGLEMTLQESAVFASKWTPWGLMPPESSTIQGEEHFYLTQPAYGTSYVIGKLEIDKLIAEYARQRDDNFVMKEFMDEFSQVGVIPVSLVYWEMTGDKSMLERALN